jgi:ATP-binding cassette subfamily B multidrug efflux pump
MKYLAKYFKPYLWGFLFLMVWVLVQAYVNLALPDYTARIVDQGIVLKNMGAIWSEGIIMLLLTLLGGLCAVIIGFIGAKISAGYAKRLRDAIFTKVESFSLGEFNIFSSSSLVTRSTNDIQQIQNVLAMLLRIAFLAPFMGIGSIIKVTEIAPGMSWVAFTAICLLVAMIVMLFFAAIPKFTIIQNLVDRLSLQTREMLTGVRVIRAYNKDRAQEEKFDKTNIESTDLNIFVNRIMALMQPVMTLIMGLSAVAVIWFGASLIGAGKLEIGNILALTQYMAQAIMSFLMISMIFIMVPRAAVSGRRINEILSVSPKINDPKTPVHFPNPIQGILEFRGVSFSYGGSAEQLVLSDISFTAKPGETTAIIGSTGSGKSTLLSLIPRLYDVTGGSITIDGVDIRDVSQHELHDAIGYIPQKTLLFSGTVESNITYGKPGASEDELRQAAAIAQATEFIDNLPDGMASSISQGGNNVSGGQKQRLTIARALVKRPPIFLFDDSFSALDFKTDAALREALQKELKQSTMVVVAQRISTIMYADHIIVLDKGVIVGQGKHDDLLATSSVYREIAESQLSADELKEKK